jgi:DNA ligase 1
MELHLDGEILCISPQDVRNSSPTGGGQVGALPFSNLQTRIGRKNITKKQLKEAPVGFIAYDLLEYNYEDWRERPLEERRKKLEEIVANASNNALVISPVVEFR